MDTTYGCFPDNLMKLLLPVVGDPWNWCCHCFMSSLSHKLWLVVVHVAPKQTNLWTTTSSQHVSVSANILIAYIVPGIYLLCINILTISTEHVQMKHANVLWSKLTDTANDRCAQCQQKMNCKLKATWCTWCTCTSNFRTRSLWSTVLSNQLHHYGMHVSLIELYVQ